MTKFDTKVKEMTNAATYDAYHQICISHYNNEIDLVEFRSQLADLFAQHEPIMRSLPALFDDISESIEKPAQEKQTG